MLLVGESRSQQLNVGTNNVEHFLATGASTEHMTAPTTVIQTRVVAVLLQGSTSRRASERIKLKVKGRTLASILAQSLLLVAQTLLPSRRGNAVVLVNENAEVATKLHVDEQSADVHEHGDGNDHKQRVGGIARVAVMQVVGASKHAGQHKWGLYTEENHKYSVRKQQTPEMPLNLTSTAAKWSMNENSDLMLRASTAKDELIKVA
jgi:hypothetical protein